MRIVILSNGAGIWANASDAFEISPSLRPVGTFQEGPPFNKNETTNGVGKINMYITISGFVSFIIKIEFLQ